MKHLRPPRPEDGRAPEAKRKRRAAVRFGFSAVIAGFVVLAMLIVGAMFQEEYEEGFVRLVSFAVRLATPEEIAQAEAQGPIPDPLPSIRPDTPIAVRTDPLVIENEWTGTEPVPPVPEALVSIEGLVVETPEGMKLLPLTDLPAESQNSREESADTE